MSLCVLALHAFFCMHWGAVSYERGTPLRVTLPSHHVFRVTDSPLNPVDGRPFRNLRLILYEMCLNLKDFWQRSLLHSMIFTRTILKIVSSTSVPEIFSIETHFV